MTPLHINGVEVDIRVGTGTGWYCGLVAGVDEIGPTRDRERFHLELQAAVNRHRALRSLRTVTQTVA